MVRFTQIDRKEPQRQFFCRVRIHPHNDQFIGTFSLDYRLSLTIFVYSG